MKLDLQNVLVLKLKGSLPGANALMIFQLNQVGNNAIIYKVKEFGNLTIKTKIHKAGYSYQKKSPQIYQK